MSVEPLRIDMVSEHASPLAALGGADAGGQNVHVASLATALARRGHQVTVFTRRDRADLPAVVRAAPGVTVRHVTAGPVTTLPKDALAPHMAEFGDRLAEHWRDRPPDVVHAHFWMSGMAAHRGARGTGVPVLQTFHALGSVKRRHQGSADTSPRYRVRAETDLAHRAALVVATCTDEVAELGALGVPAEHTAVVPCGVDLRRFTPDGPVAARGDRHRLLALGRMVPRKSVDTTIRALRHVPGAELLVAGGEIHADPELARLAGIAEAERVRDRVRFLGPVPHPDIPALLRSADLVVTVPWYEPFGMVPLEAMATGAPVVASAVGGHRDTVLDGHTGALVPPRDPDALAATLRALLADRDRRAVLGAAGPRHVRARFGWTRVAEQTERLYRGVLAHRDRPAAALTGGPR